MMLFQFERPEVNPDPAKTIIASLHYEVDYGLLMPIIEKLLSLKNTKYHSTYNVFEIHIDAGMVRSSVRDYFHDTMFKNCENSGDFRADLFNTTWKAIKYINSIDTWSWLKSDSSEEES